MSEKEYNVRVRFKYDTKENWISNNPVLLRGEAAISKNTDGSLEMRIGDGVNKFSDLKILSGGETGSVDEVLSRISLLETSLSDKVDKIEGSGLSKVSSMGEWDVLEINPSEGYAQPQYYPFYSVEKTNELIDKKVDKEDGKNLSSNDFTDMAKKMTFRRNGMEWRQLNVISRNFDIKFICYDGTNYYGLSPSHAGVVYCSKDGINFTPWVSPWLWREYQDNGYLIGYVYYDKRCSCFGIIVYKKDKSSWSAIVTDSLFLKKTDTKVYTYDTSFEEMTILDPPNNRMSQNVWYGISVDNNYYVFDVNFCIENSSTTLPQPNTFEEHICSIRTITDTKDSYYFLGVNGGIYDNSFEKVFDLKTDSTIQNYLPKTTEDGSESYGFFKFDDIKWINCSKGPVVYVVMHTNDGVIVFYSLSGMFKGEYECAMNGFERCTISQTSNFACENFRVSGDKIPTDDTIILGASEGYFMTYKATDTEIGFIKKNNYSFRDMEEFACKSPMFFQVNGNMYFCDRYFEEAIRLTDEKIDFLNKQQSLCLNHKITSVENLKRLFGQKKHVDEYGDYLDEYVEFNKSGIDIITEGWLVYDSCLNGFNKKEEKRFNEDESYDVVIDFDKCTPAGIHTAMETGGQFGYDFPLKDAIIFNEHTQMYGYAPYYTFYRPTISEEPTNNIPALSRHNGQDICCMTQYNRRGYFGTSEGRVLYKTAKTVTKTYDSGDTSLKINDIFVFTSAKGVSYDTIAVGSNGFFGELINTEIDKLNSYYFDKNDDITNDLYAVCGDNKHIVIGGDSGILFSITDITEEANLKRSDLITGENIRFIVQSLLYENNNYDFDNRRYTTKHQNEFFVVTEQGSVYLYNASTGIVELCTNVGCNIKRVKSMKYTGNTLIVGDNDKLFINDIGYDFMPGERANKTSPVLNDDGSINWNEYETITEHMNYDGKSGLVPAPMDYMVRNELVDEGDSLSHSDDKKAYMYSYMGGHGSSIPKFDSTYFLSAGGYWKDLKPYKTNWKDGVSWSPFLAPSSVFSYEDGNGYTLNINNTSNEFLRADGRWCKVSTAVFKGATDEVNGEDGLVPAPKKGEEGFYLRGDGKWADPSFSVEEKNRINALIYYDGQYTDVSSSPIGLVIDTSQVQCMDMNKTGTIVIPYNIDGTIVNTIADNGFRNSQCWEVYIPNTVTSIGINTFKDATSLMSLQLPNSITELGTSCFENCSSLKEIYLGNGITEIPASAFKDCSALKTIYIPETVTFIDETAFEGCLSNLRFYTIEGSVADKFAMNKGFDCLYAATKKKSE